MAAAGGRPLLIPPTSTAPGGPEAGAEQVKGVAMLDGLVLTGGGDIDPAAYGEEADPEVGGVDLDRDASERALLAAALEADIPVLAICRGCQVLNVYLGGNLHQHLPDVVDNLDHRKEAMDFEDVVMNRAGHLDGRRLRRLHQRALLAPPGHPWHLGRDLVITARARDGVVEAVELPTARFVLAVQWHPEEAMDQRPFDALIKGGPCVPRGADRSSSPSDQFFFFKKKKKKKKSTLQVRSRVHPGPAG